MSDQLLNAKIKHLGYTPFTIKKEAPNYYKLKDGAMLRIYPILNAVVLDAKKPGGLWVNIQNVVHAYIPKKLVKKPPIKKYSAEDASKKLDKTDIEFDVISEHFNEYRVGSKDLLYLKTILSQVNRSKLRNNFGEPIYLVNTTMVPKLKKK